MAAVDVLIVGAGLMGAQIGCEYALGGHEVALLARDAEAAWRRFEQGLETARAHGLASAEEVEAARRHAKASSELDTFTTCGLAIESVPEDMELKARLLHAVAEGSPEAILATNTSSLSVSALGDRIGAPERTLGTHYWNPPLLMPLVEVVAGKRTDPGALEQVTATLRALGKRPVYCTDLPGFVWNRLQMAVLREAVSICELGAVSPETVDEIVTYGLARRWQNIGFFEAIALGGVETWQRTARNLLPGLSAATEIRDLGRFVPSDPGALAEAAARRDRGLARDLRKTRNDDSSHR